MTAVIGRVLRIPALPYPSRRTSYGRLVRPAATHAAAMAGELGNQTLTHQRRGALQPLLTGLRLFNRSRPVLDQQRCAHANESICNYSFYQVLIYKFKYYISYTSI